MGQHRRPRRRTRVDVRRHVPHQQLDLHLRQRLPGRAHRAGARTGPGLLLLRRALHRRGRHRPREGGGQDADGRPVAVHRRGQEGHHQAQEERRGRSAASSTTPASSSTARASPRARAAPSTSRRWSAASRTPSSSPTCAGSCRCAASTRSTRTPAASRRRSPSGRASTGARAATSSPGGAPKRPRRSSATRPSTRNSRPSCRDRRARRCTRPAGRLPGRARWPAARRCPTPCAALD